ncbi:hypothetical protein GCM10025867_47380 (plasmid) [Frondihabitans sucicola]|uniref:Flavodoxin-like domain-containing protein n=1 Tax=Frondihabitans sucicola TaxID=1268041 RepID=A0ABN6Y589_9MICO|nr:hypothetical protein [Frondihabitans sucicola]BDZ52497.1 hypothetical protein GCM10025867_47380 [Frondihabitans sucicola]
MTTSVTSTRVAFVGFSGGKDALGAIAQAFDEKTPVDNVSVEAFNHNEWVKALQSAGSTSSPSPTELSCPAPTACSSTSAPKRVAKRHRPPSASLK